MSKIFKRLLCALLGMIIGMVSTLGAVAATVYYTYGNLTVGDVSGNKYKDALGDLNSFSVEDIIGLAIKGGKAPENYTFADLEKDYGFDLVAFINQLGGGEEEVISTAESNQKYIDDLKKTSVFALFNGDGFQKFMNNLSYGAVLSFIPASQVFSEQERLKLRRYTLGEMNQKDAEGQTGLVKALRNVRVGGVLPRIFDYDEQTDKYSVKDGFYKGLNVIANVELDSFIDIVNKKSDWATEICEGGLSSVGKLSVSEILKLCQVPDSVAKHIVSLVGDLKTRDLFVKNDEGKYVFKADNLYDNIKVGGALGLEYRDDGLWYTSSGEAAKGIFQTVASVNLKSLIHAFTDKDNNDALSMARKVALVFGNFSVGNALEMVGYTKGEDGAYTNKNGEEPKMAILSVLSDLKINDVLYGSEAMTWGRIRFKLMSAVKSALIEKGKADMTVGEAFGGIIGIKAERADGKVTFTSKNGEKLNTAFVKMLETPVMDYVDAFGQETFEKAKVLAFVNTLMGDIKLGYFVGANDASGKWLDKNGAAVDEKYAKIYGITVSDILVPIMNGEKNPLQLIVNILGPSSTVGEYVAPLIGVKQTESGEWDYADIKVSQLKRFKFAFNKVFNLTLDNFTSVDKAKTALKDAFRHARLGELAGYTRNDESGAWNFNNSQLKRFSAVIYKLFDIELKDCTSINEIKAAVKNAIGDMPIGEAVGYTKNASGKWNINNAQLKKVAGVANALLDIKIKQCTSKEGIKNAVKDAIMDMPVGEALNYTKGADGKWYKENGTLVSEGSAQDKVIAEICDKTLQEVYDNQDDLSVLINDMKAGELMNYTYCDGDGTDCGVTAEGHIHDKGWYKKNATTGVYEKCDVLMQRINDQKLGTLMNGGMDLTTVFDGIKLGEVLKYTYDAENKYWTKTDADGTTVKKVSAIEGVVADIELSQMLNGSIDLSAQFDDIYLGELMGYEPVKDTTGNIVKWEKDGVQLTDEVLLCVVGFKFSEVKGSGFSDKMLDNVKSKVTIGTVLIQKDADGNVVSNPWQEGNRTAISVIPKNTPIGEVSTVIQDKMQNGTAGELYDAGLLPLQNQQEKMKSVYGAIAVVKVKNALQDGTLDRNSKEYLAVKAACKAKMGYQPTDEYEPTDAEVDAYIATFSITLDTTTMKMVVTPKEEVEKVGYVYWRSLTTSELVDVLLANVSF